MNESVAVPLALVVIFGAWITILAWVLPAPVGRLRDQFDRPHATESSLRLAILLICWPLLLLVSLFFWLILR